MKKIFKNWDNLMIALVLVKIGQELGSDSKYAHFIHDAIEFIIRLTK